MVFQKNELEEVFATAVFKESTGVEERWGVPCRAGGWCRFSSTKISPGQANCCRPARGADGACSHANDRV